MGGHDVRDRQARGDTTQGSTYNTVASAVAAGLIFLFPYHRQCGEERAGGDSLDPSVLSKCVFIGNVLLSAAALLRQCAQCTCAVGFLEILCF